MFSQAAEYGFLELEFVIMDPFWLSILVLLETSKELAIVYVPPAPLFPSSHGQFLLGTP